MAAEQSLVQTTRRSVNALYRVQQVGGVFAGLAGVGMMAGGATASLVGIPIIALVFGGSVLLAKRQARRFVVEAQLAGDAMGRGELAKAHEIFDYWADIKNNHRIMVLACHNLASVFTQQGKLEEARRLHLENSEHELKWLRRTGLTKLSAAGVAYTNALLGDLDAATRWITIAERRSKLPQMPNADPSLIIVRVIVGLRRGQSEEAARLLDDNWTMIEGRVVAKSLRTYRLLRGFARVSMGPRDAGRGHEDVAMVRPQYPNEHAYLGTAWPEMAAFLATHGLVP